MTNAYDEGAYIKNNTESDFHCLLLSSVAENGVISGAHYHNYIEILYGVDCKCNVWINDEIFTFSSGDLIVVNSRETHSVTSSKSENSYYVIKFSPDILKNDKYVSYEGQYILSLLGNEFSRYRLIAKNEVDKTDIPQIVNQIYNEWNNSLFGYEMAMRGGSLMLYAQIARIWSKDMVLGGPPDETTKAIHSAANYATEHLADICEEDVAQLFGMSYSYFSRTFKKVMNKSFTSFVNELRIDNARRLLLTTNISITEIAQESGFSTSSHFISGFKRKTGHTPLEYRKKLTNK